MEWNLKINTLFIDIKVAYNKIAYKIIQKSVLGKVLRHRKINIIEKENNVIEVAMIEPEFLF